MRDKLIVGYDLGKKVSQISFCKYSDNVPQTISQIADGESFDIPTALCKRSGLSQWYFGNDALSHANDEDVQPVEDLLTLAREGIPVIIDDTEFDPVALLTLFVKRSLTLLSAAGFTEKIGALLITCENMDSRMAEVLNAVVDGMGLKLENVAFESYVESFFHYMIHQPEDLWIRDVLLCRYTEDKFVTYKMICNRKTVPSVVFMEENEFPAGPSEERDETFCKCLEKACGTQIVTSAYLIGDSFSEGWMKKSLAFLCRGRRVFQGTNMFSKGACYGMMERLTPSEVGKGHVYLGKDKLKANVGMKIKRWGKDSYFPLMDAGIAWYEARADLEFYLRDNNCFELVITPLTGKDVRTAYVTLDGLPPREGAGSRLYLEINMTTESHISLLVEDLGFGEMYPSSHQQWLEEFDIGM